MSAALRANARGKTLEIVFMRAEDRAVAEKAHAAWLCGSGFSRDALVACAARTSIIAESWLVRIAHATRARAPDRNRSHRPALRFLQRRECLGHALQRQRARQRELALAD